MTTDEVTPRPRPPAVREVGGRSAPSPRQTRLTEDDVADNELGSIDRDERP